MGFFEIFKSTPPEPTPEEAERKRIVQEKLSKVGEMREAREKELAEKVVPAEAPFEEDLSSGVEMQDAGPRVAELRREIPELQSRIDQLVEDMTRDGHPDDVRLLDQLKAEKVEKEAELAELLG